MSSNNTSSSDAVSTAAAGVAGGYTGDNLALKFSIFFFAGLSIYNALELVVLIFSTFNTYSGLYFWSLLVASFGLIPYSLGFSLKLFQVLTGDARLVAVALLTVGWYTMVTGQSVVLWSRLHLIVRGERGQKILKYTKWMIICDVFILHLPTTVVTFGSNGTLQTAEFIQAYNVIEKFQMTGFFLQEVILSSIYIIETIRILSQSLRPEMGHRLMYQLILINVAIVIMDIALLSMECASLFLLETIFKGFVYSVKLKLEFAILSRLVAFVGGGNGRTGSESTRQGRSMTFIAAGKSTRRDEQIENMNDISDFVDLTKSETACTHAESERTTRRPTRTEDSALDIESWETEGIYDTDSGKG